VRRSWISLLAIIVAVPALAQNQPPAGPALVEATAQAQQALAATPTANTTVAAPTGNKADDLKAALDAEVAQKQNLQLQPSPEQAAAVVPTPRANTQKVAAAPPVADSTIAPMGVNNQASTDALARALAEQAQRAAQASAFADAQRADAEQKLHDQSFEAAKKGTFPLSPEEIKDVMRRFEDTQYAVVPPSYGQPKGETAVNTVSLDPGAEPPEILVAVGYVTSLAILDATGQPWPIIDIGVGGNFDVPQPEQGSHIIRIAPMTRFGYGNLSIRLKDLPTPVNFRVSAGNDIVHYRYDARIPRMGPNAKMSLIEKQKIVAGDDVIMAVLDNAIPSGSHKLKVTGTDKRTLAYRIGERVFVRTPLTLLSPSWRASVSSADGTTVYEVGETPVLLLSDQGQMVRAKITDDGA